MGAAVAASLALAGTAHAAIVPVKSLDGDWSGRGQVDMNDRGVHFDVSDWGSGTVKYAGVHGKTLDEISRLTYTARYNTNDPAGEGKDAPYLRIFFTNGKDAIYDPTAPGNDKGTLGEDVDHTRNVMTGDWRYDDDCGDGILDSTESSGCGNNDWEHPEGTPGYGLTGAPYSTLKADHGDEQIDFIAVSAGNQFHDQVEAVMTRMRVNGDEFNFGATGPKGDTGAAGTAGAKGADGVKSANGKDGKNGAKGATGPAGSNGVNGVNGVTTISRDYGKLSGATLRTLRAPKLKGMKFVGVRASLRGKRLHARGRSVRVDLRGKSVGRYNVLMFAKYKNKRTGKVHTVRSVRGLSVARS
jgi:hypothetical protein